MTTAVKSALTLAVLALLVAVGAAWGWSALTQPVPGRTIVTEELPPQLCVEREVAAGDRITTREVTVSVFNAGGRSGQANSTMQLLAERGFAEGRTGNAPAGTGVRFVRIWADDPDNPAVRLVARHLGNPVVRPNEGIDAPGVVVLVGNEFEGLSDARPRLRAQEDAVICSPQID